MTHRYHLTGAAAVLLLSGCDQKPSAPMAATAAAAAPHDVFFAGPSAVITDAACTGTKNPKKVKFKISERMLRTLGGANQYVEREVAIEEPGGSTTPQSAPPADIAKNYQPTYLDIGVPAPDGEAMWTQVVVRLKQNNPDLIRFMPVRDANGVDSPTDSSYAVLAEASNASRFCGREPIRQVNGDDVVRFGVKMPLNQTVSINIGLLIADKKNPGYWIPIYLDPNMKNIG